MPDFEKFSLLKDVPSIATDKTIYMPTEEIKEREERNFKELCYRIGFDIGAIEKRLTKLEEQSRIAEIIPKVENASDYEVAKRIAGLERKMTFDEWSNSHEYKNVLRAHEINAIGMEELMRETWNAAINNNK